MEWTAIHNESVSSAGQDHLKAASQSWNSSVLFQRFCTEDDEISGFFLMTLCTGVSRLSSYDHLIYRKQEKK